MKEYKLSCAVALILVSFIDVSNCDVINKSHKKDLNERLVSLELRLDDIFLDLIRGTPKQALKVLNAQLDNLESKLAHLSLSSKLCGLVSRVCIGESDEKDIRMNLASVHLFRTVALQALGDDVEALVELKKTLKQSKYLRGSRLEDLQEWETQLTKKITDTYIRNPKALFGFEHDEFYVSELMDAYRTLVNKIEALRRPKDATLSYVRDILGQTFNQLSKVAL